jgi:hypothetical protein
MRHLYVTSVLFLTLATASAAAADSATITSGAVGLFWDGSLSGFQLTGPGTQLIGEVMQSPPDGFSAGTRADLNDVISTTNQSNHPFTEQVNGTTYSSVWIKATLTFTTQQMAIPAAPDGTRKTLSTPFSMTGQFAGYSDQALTNQVFAVAVHGSGIASIVSLRYFAAEQTWSSAGAGSLAYTFSGPLPSPWTSTDVGVVGQGGISSFDRGSFYVAGAGADIWGAADSFQFVSQPLAGDGSIVARVDDEQTTSQFAKAGIMIRQTGDRSAAHVVLDLKPDGGVEFMTRSAAGGGTTFLAGATVSSRPWLKLARAGSRVTASVSTDGSTWTVLGSAELAGSALVGLAVTSHDTTVLNQAIFDQVSVTAGTPTGGTLPISWSHADVGGVGQPGSASESGGAFTVIGAGADIWGAADAFHYAYTPMNSDGDIEARVTRMENTNRFAKAGLMFRDSLDPGATHAILDVKPDGGIEFMARTSASGSTTFIAGFQASFPVSLRLVRIYGTVNSIIVAFALDPATARWRQLGWVTIPLGPGTVAGLAVTSHDASVLNTAVFDQTHVVKNLIVQGGFEGYTPPSLGPPGWVSDNPRRAVAAHTETHQPHDGAMNGVCSTTTFADCGMYQEVTAPADGDYVLTMFANADRAGGLVGVNVNGVGVKSLPVDVRSFGNYGTAPYTMRFTAAAGDTLRVWMYSPPSPGFVVVDDVTLQQDFDAP